ncbi:hypothetical protein ETB97_012748 [Aspergillus alliaceus]|uniref:Terpene synthase n=1 Tax=Petromyces alliaceus TaxID=209559 RepID=A0A8H6E6X0_PETAA|nr:hypothetical protein ETB97_012748 [Aspergillus burnettii]
MTVPPPSITAAADLLSKCTGQQVTIPSLFSLSPAWKPRLNQDYNICVQAHLDVWLHKYITGESSLRRSHQIDAPFFVRTLYPEAGLKELYTLAKFYCWLFAWDDVVDYHEFKDQSQTREIYRSETITCIQKSLCSKHSYNPVVLAPTYKMARGFYEIGREICEGVKNETVRHLIANSLCDYVNTVINVQASLDSGEVPSLDIYLDTRTMTSAISYAYHLDLPDWLLYDDLVRKLMKHANLFVSIGNDIISLRNEMTNGHVDNIVPLLMHHEGIEPQQAVARAVQMVTKSYMTLQDLESQINQAVLHDEEVF